LVTFGRQGYPVSFGSERKDRIVELQASLSCPAVINLLGSVTSVNELRHAGKSAFLQSKHLPVFSQSQILTT
jgi:hypothetical protein